MSLQRRVAALELRRITRGPWSDEVEETLRSLRREERERAQKRKEFGEFVARLWECMGESERAAGIRVHGARADDLSILQRPEIQAAAASYLAKMAVEEQGRGAPSKQQHPPQAK